MNHIQQPRGTSLCGQCVVAMLADVPLTQVIAVMGRGRTYPAGLRKALRRFGVSIPARSIPGSIEAPSGRGAAMIWGERQHWVAWDEGTWFDPANERPLSDLLSYDPQQVTLYPVQGYGEGQLGIPNSKSY